MPTTTALVCLRVSTNPEAPIPGSLVDHCLDCDAEVWVAPQSMVGTEMHGINRNGEPMTTELSMDAIVMCIGCAHQKAVDSGHNEVAAELLVVAAKMGEMV